MSRGRGSSRPWWTRPGWKCSTRSGRPRRRSRPGTRSPARAPGSTGSAASPAASRRTARGQATARPTAAARTAATQPPAEPPRAKGNAAAPASQSGAVPPGLRSEQRRRSEERRGKAAPLSAPEASGEDKLGPDPAVAAVRLGVRRCLSGAGLAPGDLVLAACSGGADSLALAAAAAFEAPRLGLSAGGVTVDHGLQDGSAEQARKVTKVLTAIGL